ncbi:MAG: cytochrome c oxidase subunit 3 [Gammaproteobacteria bacterium]|nr:cytochrome c oxidase subunit 3 [Gammaproteobacteria bacterium]
MSDVAGSYYLPEPSKWPVVGSIGLFLTTGGFAYALTSGVDGAMGSMTIMYIGFAVMAYMLFGWFGQVIDESEAGKYNDQVDTSFRMGMMWFIFSEVMFFAAFFGALFYARNLAGPWLGGEGNNVMTQVLLWSDFTFEWPMLSTPGEESTHGEKFSQPTGIIGAWGVPFYNTLILLTSGLTITWAHWGLKKDNRKQLIIGLFLTVALGFLFVFMQAEEYIEAYTQLNLKLSSGTYGSTFFMLTGFHGLHVTIGAIMLTVMLVRSIKGHFTEKHHFAFEAAAWYWHFVDVVWLGLFIMVYWI